MKDLEQQLQAPFKPNEIEWRVGVTNKDKTKGIALPYVTNRAIQKRLDDVFGIYGWKNEFVTWKDNKQLCGISVYYEGEWITKWDGADDSNMDGTKGGLSNAMKRSACQWGIGRYLYDIPNRWYKIEPNGKSYKLAETPKLPDWAIPKGEVQTLEWEQKEIKKELPKAVEECLKAFEKLGITKQELENYLNNEACMFDEQNLNELRQVFISIKNGETAKEDYFENATYEKQSSAKALTQALKEVTYE